MARNIMMVLDGMQDIAYKELGDKTPYDAGKGDAFRKIEASSQTGRLITTPKGFEADTQTCVLTLLGVEAKDIPGGRTYNESLAVGVTVGDNDIIMRCNFVKISDDGILEVPCCNAPKEIADTLLAEVAAVPGYSVTQVGSYKSLQWIQDGRRYADTMVTYPPHNYGGKPLEELLPSGNELADRLADFTRETLKKHRPYTVFNWGQAVKDDLPLFAGLHGGITGAMVSKTHAPMGGAIAMGMACPDLPTATGDTDTDLAAKVEATLAMTEQYDFVMLHVGGPDEATHRQDPLEKADFIAKMDRELIAPILDRVPDGTRIMVTCDHEALCSTAGHTDKPVEFLLYEKGKKLSGDLGTQEGTRAISLLRGEA